MPLCGRNTSAVCGVISTWGVLQLALTGLFAYLHCPALIEDISLPESPAKTATEFARDLDLGYKSTALNCWVAALLYLTTLCVSAHQYWANGRAEDNQFKATKF